MEQLQQQNNISPEQAYLSNIINAIIGSLNSNDQVRKQAEEFIMQVNSIYSLLIFQQADKTEGYSASLIHISLNPQLLPQQSSLQISQQAAVLLGAFVEKNWKFNDQEHLNYLILSGHQYYTVISENDKSFVRSNLFTCLSLHNNGPIKKQYLRCLSNAIRYDYPNKWPNLLETILDFLTKKDEKFVIVALQALNCLCKKYEFDLQKSRLPLEQIVSQTFGVLGNLINQIIQVQANETILTMIHLICKIFYKANQLQMSAYLCNPDTLHPWMMFVKQLLDMKVPDLLESKTTDTHELEERNKNIYWKIKGITSKVSYRLLLKYSNSKNQTDETKQFFSVYASKYPLLLLESHLALVLKTKTHFVGDEALNNSLKYLTYALKIPNLKKVMKPFFNTLLYETLIPILYLTEKDVISFNEDPIEFIRKGQDLTSYYLDNRSAILPLIEDLCRPQKKLDDSETLQTFFKFCFTNLQEYSKLNSADWRIKEALVRTIQHLKYNLEGQKELHEQLEYLLIHHVLTDLTGPINQLKSLACQVYAEYGDFPFKNEVHVTQAIEGIYKCMFDSSLPVRLHACIALPKAIGPKAHKEALIAAIPTILETYLKIISEIESEELVQALEQFIALYEAFIGPYAVKLCQELAQSYKNLIKAGETADDPDGEYSLAAASCITTIKRIVCSVRSNPEVLEEIQKQIFPILLYCFQPDGIDAIEETLDIILFLIYNSKQGQVSELMWKFYYYLLFITGGTCDKEEGYDAVERGYAYEYFSNIALIMQNYFQKDPETFVSLIRGSGQVQNQSRTYFDLTLVFLKKMMVLSKQDESFGNYLLVLKIFIALLENIHLKNQEVLIKFIMEILFVELAHPQLIEKQQIIASMIFQTVSICLWTNAPYTLQVLEQSNMTTNFFSQWMKHLPSFKKEFEIRRNLFGLTSLVKTNLQSLPPIVKSNLPEIAKQIAILTDKVVNIRKHELTFAQDEDRFGLKKRDDSDGEYDEEGLTDQELDQIIQDRQGMPQSKEDYEGTLSDDEDINGDNFEYKCCDLAYYDSVLETIDEVLFVKESFQQIGERDLNLYQNLLSKLSARELSDFNQAMQEIEQLIQKEKARIPPPTTTH